MFTWGRLLAALKKRGFDTENATVDQVKAFAAEKGIKFEDAEGNAVDIDAVYTAHTKAKPETVVLTGGEDDDESDTVTVKKSDIEALKKQAKVGVDAARGSKAHIVNRVDGADVRVGGHRRYASEAESKSYNAKPRDKRSFNDADEAINFGIWAKSILAPRLMTKDDHDLLLKANITTTNTSGGALVPNDFLPQLIDLKELRGVARTAIPYTPMGRDQLTRPRRTGGVTVYYPGEAGAITESNPTFNNVTATAVKMATLTQVSNELLHDSALSFGDIVGREIAYAFADKEDEDVFNGDGTSTYGGRTGLRQALKGLSGTIANIAGLFVGAGNAYSELVITDFDGVAGLLPAYVTNPKWYMHKRFFETVCGGIAQRPGASGGAGGATISEIANYRMSGSPTWLGYPVVFTQVMPRAEANSQVCALFGDLGLGSMQGVVNGSMEIASSTEYGFNTDVLTIRGIQRHAFTAHDPGNASATEALRVPGPFVGLITAAS